MFSTFDILRNHDGNKIVFGDLSVRTANSDTVNAGVYTGFDAGNEDRMVVIFINNSESTETADITVTHSRRFLKGGGRTLVPIPPPNPQQPKQRTMPIKKPCRRSGGRHGGVASGIAVVKAKSEQAFNFTLRVSFFCIRNANLLQPESCMKKKSRFESLAAMVIHARN